MAANEGQVFGAGIRILLKGANDVLVATAGTVAYLHFVDPDGTTIVPEYEAAGLSTFAGSLSGAKITIPSPANLTAAEDRIQLLESGGRWAVSMPFVGATAPEDVALEVGKFHRLDLSAYGSGDTCTCTLPLATADNVGRRIAVSVISSTSIGGGGPEVEITTTSAQTIDGRTLPIALAGVRPGMAFVSVVVATDVEWGWSVEP